jgi:hypothetical protein
MTGDPMAKLKQGSDDFGRLLGKTKEELEDQRRKDEDYQECHRREVEVLIAIDDLSPPWNSVTLSQELGRPHRPDEVAVRLAGRILDLREKVRANGFQRFWESPELSERLNPERMNLILNWLTKASASTITKRIEEGVASVEGDKLLRNLWSRKDGIMALRNAFASYVRPVEVVPIPPPEILPPQPKDGYDGRTGFRILGVFVDFRRASKRLRLMRALWDNTRAAPCKAREKQDVIDEVYGSENETKDTTFSQLMANTNQKLAADQAPGKIHQRQSMVWLEIKTD